MADKVIQIFGIIGDPKSWRVVEQGTEELVLVPIVGRSDARMRMRKSEAIAKGLWKEPESEVKAQPPTKNKQRRPAANKARAE